MKTLQILLMALCLVAAVQVAIGEEKFQDVGGDFGRTWSNYGQAQSSGSAAQDDADLFSWGGVPKGNNTTSQNGNNLLSEDWLNTTAILGDSNLTKNNTTNETANMIPYHIGKTFSPIHEMDSSFNQSIQAPQLPQPDKNGLINGIPAEIYYALGPAYLDF